MKKRHILNAYVAAVIIAAALGVGTAYAANHLLSQDEVTVDVIAHTPTPTPSIGEDDISANQASTQTPREAMGFTKLSGPDGPSEVTQGEQARYTVSYEADVIPSCDVDAPSHVDASCRTLAREATFMLQTDEPGEYTATLNLYINESVR